MQAMESKELRLEEDELGLLQDWGIKGVHVEQAGRERLHWSADGEDRPAAVLSCTKSVLSALIGIAIGQRLIGGEEDPIVAYLDVEEPGLAEALRDDPRKRSITIAQLLNMTSGLDWPDFDKPYRELKRAENPASFVLGRPLAHEPGAVFAYNTGGSQLLAIALERACGRSLSTFARRHLFGPLGAGPVRWSRLAGGQEGGAGLSMTMRGLAKLGRLYAQGGRWQGEQIVPQEWVEASVKPRHKGLLHYEPQVYGCYGYHWWVSPQDKQPGPNYFFAFGYGGQYLFVVPELEAVAVVRKRPEGRNKAILSRQLFERHLLPALRDG
ncbi:serine hydrolase [Paenibacillus albicereus]|uniref:Serine hydrolase n=1 Tax=Paenibacillus albicereus TaxID=2726185 RepID=A0A6H2GXN5_9BACL|nr:serine hydrolase [Paenibacillus albicereus]QJC52165.1 serine hydrolase [Paenibacillus albicereus]